MNFFNATEGLDMKYLLLAPLFLSSVFVLSCDRIEKPSDPVSTQLLESQPPVASDGSFIVTQFQWCRVEDWKAFQIVLRITAGQEEMKRDYLRLYPNQSPVSYPIEQTTSWSFRKGRNPIEDNPTHLRWIVTPVDEPALRDPPLIGFDDQKKLAEQVLRGYPQLVMPDGPFLPKRGLNVKARDTFSGGVVERNLYPCSSYALDFTQGLSERPMIELILKLSKSLETYTAIGLNQLARAMELVEPIEEAAMTKAMLAGTHWCAWRQVDLERLKLYTLSFSDTQMLENAYTENFRKAGSHAAALDFIERNSRLSEFFILELTQSGRIQASNVSQSPLTFPQRELITMVKDAAGRRALIRLTEKQPDLSRPSFDDLYFECAHPVPLAFSPGFREFLTNILDVQGKVLTSSPATGGREVP